jgi:hypothetical protein
VRFAVEDKEVQAEHQQHEGIKNDPEINVNFHVPVLEATMLALNF